MQESQVVQASPHQSRQLEKMDDQQLMEPTADPADQDQRVSQVSLESLVHQG